MNLSSTGVLLLNILIIWTSCINGISSNTSRRPNIIFILADDLGWNDVSFHGSSQIPTPNIDALGYHGVILDQHYAQPFCTPSRSALLTGKYPTRTGTQHSVILENEPWGLPLHEKLLSQYLKELGYATHAIGKWHLGMFKKEYTPTYRGFDSFYGFWQSYQDYYNHTVQATMVPFEGYDMHRNLEIDWSHIGEYSTDLFTREAEQIITSHANETSPLFVYLAYGAVHAATYDDPLQAPQEEIDRMKHIYDPKRRIYAAMVSRLDKSVGKIVSALDKSGMLDNTLIVFSSDNGAQTKGPYANSGSNWPFKGVKGTLWEGGIRTPTVFWSRELQNLKQETVVPHIFHITDWLPTLYNLAGGEPAELPALDGVDQWPALVGKSPIRTEVLLNIDPVNGYEAIRVGDFKYIKGVYLLGVQDVWYGDAGTFSTGYWHSMEEYLLAIEETPVYQSIALKKKKHQARNRLNEIVKIREEATIRCSRKIKPPSRNDCVPHKTPCLFNLASDPCERQNLYKNVSENLISAILSRLERHRSQMINPENRPGDVRANPIFWNNTWTNWKDYTL